MFSKPFLSLTSLTHVMKLLFCTASNGRGLGVEMAKIHTMIVCLSCFLRFFLQICKKTCWLGQWSWKIMYISIVHCNSIFLIRNKCVEVVWRPVRRVPSHAVNIHWLQKLLATFCKNVNRFVLLTDNHCNSFLTKMKPNVLLVFCFFPDCLV